MKQERGLDFWGGGYVTSAGPNDWWRFRIYFKMGFGCLDRACCITAGWRVSPAGFQPCLLSWGIPANPGSVNCFCHPISNLAYVQSQFLDTMMEPGTSAAHVCSAYSEISSKIEKYMPWKGFLNSQINCLCIIYVYVSLSCFSNINFPHAFPCSYFI